MLNEKEGEREMLLNILYNYYIEYIIQLVTEVTKIQLYQFDAFYSKLHIRKEESNLNFNFDKYLLLINDVSMMLGNKICKFKSKQFYIKKLK